MSQFSTIREAITYIPNCPMCKAKLNGFSSRTNGPSRVDIELIDNWYQQKPQYNFIFVIRDDMYKDEYKINIDSYQVERTVTEIKEQEELYSGSSRGYRRYSVQPPPTSGMQYLAIGIECEHCKKYNYLLQVRVDLMINIIRDVVFNSETCIFQADELSERREIKNIYTTKETLYSYMPKAGPGMIVNRLEQKLPLLPLNREDPDKTLTRIRNLLIFT